MRMIKPYILIFIIALVLTGCSSTTIEQNPAGTFPSASSSTNSTGSPTSPDNSFSKADTSAQSTATTTIPAKPDGLIKVHFIDVGQGDSELIQTPDNHTMLIDTGTNASTTSLINYLKSQKVSKIDFLILTHPHEDHIGGADAVIKDFNITTVYMPKVTTTTKTFEDVVNVMKAKGLKASQPAPGTSFNLGEANCTILGPIKSNSDDLNTYSIVLKLTFGKNSFLFTGDAQASNEEDMINKGYNLSANVLKVGHHGSDTSTSQQFLNAVHPQYAVISCGKGNDYGHPHKATIDKLKAAKIPVYRTDECGSIIASSDGNSITFNVKPGDYAYGSSKSSSSSSESVTRSSTIPATDVAPRADISASLDNETPAQNSRIMLTVTGPQGAPYTAVCHYKSKDTTFSGKVGTPLTIDISRAAKDFTVEIDVTMNYNGKTYTARTSFTPR